MIPRCTRPREGNQYYFGAKANIGAARGSSRRQCRGCYPGDKLLHGEERVVCVDAGYTDVEKCSEHEGQQVIWQIEARRSASYQAICKVEKAEAQIRTKVEHSFRVIKRQFSYAKVRFRGLAKTRHRWSRGLPVKLVDGSPTFVGYRRRWACNAENGHCELAAVKHRQSILSERFESICRV